MATNANDTPGTVINTSTTSDSPVRKTTPSRKTKTPRKSTGAPRQRTPARTATVAEILFTALPNPSEQPVPPYIWIDHPSQDERLLGPIYNVRMGIGGAQATEISIDGGEWLPCRLTSGYWWYDWSAIKPGKHTLVARMRTPDGRWYRTPVRHCEYHP